MLKMVERLKRRWKLFSFLCAVAVTLAVMFHSGFASDIITATFARLPSSGAGYGSGDEYYGPWTLEERIVRADAIARVKLRSVAQVVELFPSYDSYGTFYGNRYVGAVEFTFDALEYLKGSGGSQLTAVADDFDVFYETELGASTMGENLLSSRDKRWDDREAIVFLRKHDVFPSTKQADRYWLGSLRFSREDQYTIASPRYQVWLPDATATTPAVGGTVTSAASSGDEQRFLLKAPSGVATAASGQGETERAPTITLSELKTLIAELQAEVAAGGNSTEYTSGEYRQCVALKYQDEREVLYTIDLYGEYYYRRIDSNLASGSLAGAQVFTYEWAGFNLSEFGDSHPSKFGEFWIGEVDSDLFSAAYPGIVSTVRPLPRGEYRFYYAAIPYKFAICDGLHEEQKKRREIFVTVTAPTGTLHEAFFDPIAEDAALVADDFRGTLKPTDFRSDGATTTIARIG